MRSVEDSDKGRGMASVAAAEHQSDMFVIKPHIWEKITRQMEIRILIFLQGLMANEAR